jgi:hypothetical protein
MAIVVAGHKQDSEIGLDPVQVFHQHRTAHARHDDIDKEEIGAVGETFKFPNRGVRVLRDDYFVAFILQDRLQETKDIRIVVDNQYGPAAGWFRAVG